MGLMINPITKTHIHEAVFGCGEIIIYPDEEKIVLEELIRVVRYLFGESTQLVFDYMHGHRCIRLTKAAFVIANSTSVNASWIVEREEPTIITTEK